MFTLVNETHPKCYQGKMKEIFFSLTVLVYIERIEWKMNSMFIDDILQSQQLLRNYLNQIGIFQGITPNFFSDGLKCECLLKHFHSFATPAD